MRKYLFLAVMAVVLFACEENTVKDSNPEEEIVSEKIEELVLKDAEVEEAEEMADYEIDFFSATTEAAGCYGAMWNKFQQNYSFGGRYRVGHCPYLAADSVANAFPKTITIDYGDGIELYNGRTISGKIIITLSAPAFTDGSVREITYEDFSIDSLSISGTKTMTFEGTDSTRVFSVASEMTYTFADSSTISRTVNKTKEWVAGLDTELNPFDDIIEITGSIKVVGKDGTELLKEITEPLVKTGTCMFITQGVVTFFKNGEEIGNLDYGDGTCDYIAELTLNGVTEEIFVGLRFGKCSK